MTVPDEPIDREALTAEYAAFTEALPGLVSELLLAHDADPNGPTFWATMTRLSLVDPHPETDTGLRTLVGNLADYLGRYVRKAAEDHGAAVATGTVGDPTSAPRLVRLSVDLLAAAIAGDDAETARIVEDDLTGPDLSPVLFRLLDAAVNIAHAVDALGQAAKAQPPAAPNSSPHLN